ncbi:MAG: serine/threonine protein kinase [Myxococcaceae bacterium]|jgi:serine/threonine protein kinase|nr:serine/threonine protein kinase [Myxococcaceae bacterium]
MSASDPPPAVTLDAGTLLGGRYRIVRLIGSGGMGAVYEGVQEGLGRRVALKVLHARLAHTPDLVERFRREAQAAAALAHPHIVQVSDSQMNEGEPPFIVMEFLEGRSLGDRIRQDGPLPAERVAKIFAQVLDGLATAHRAGIVHRDIKPDNVFLTSSSTLGDLVKLVDFGVAKIHAEGEAPLTIAGTVIGTLTYMAPEQARGATVDARTDIYAVAGCMYYALSRRRPLEGRQGPAMLAAIVMDEPAPLSSHVADVDRELEAIVHRALQKEPDARFSTADEMRQALTSWLAARTQQAHSQPPPAHSGPVHSPRPELITSTDPTLRSRSSSSSRSPEPDTGTSKIVYLVLGAAAALFVLAAAGMAIFVALNVKDTVEEGATTTNATAPAVVPSAPTAAVSAKPPALRVVPKKPDAGAAHAPH